MPLPADGRRRLERMLRIIGLGAIAAALVMSLRDPAQGAGIRTVPSASLAAELRRGLRAETLAVVTDTALDPVHRDWLAAQAEAGRPVRWGGGPIPALALAIDPAPDPAGGALLAVAAPGGAELALADAAGPLGQARSSGGGATILVPQVSRSGEARTGLHRARALARDSVALRRVVVFGRPSWETKFVIVALEERGWVVDARVPLRPDTALVHGAPGRLDTARVAAVVALDGSAAPEARRIAAFVQQGGGLVLGAEAAAHPAFAALRAGTAGPRRIGTLAEIRAELPRQSLPLVPILLRSGGAVALERRGGEVAVAARRFGPARVVQTGYEDTWRWRMSGPEGAVLAHRAWWSGLVGAAAYRPTIPVSGGDQADDAPLARMVARIGPAESVAGLATGGRGRTAYGPPAWLLTLALASLVAEWASRRLRGAV